MPGSPTPCRLLSRVGTTRLDIPADWGPRPTARHAQRGTVLPASPISVRAAPTEPETGPMLMGRSAGPQVVGAVPGDSLASAVEGERACPLALRNYVAHGVTFETRVWKAFSSDRPIVGNAPHPDYPKL